MRLAMIVRYPLALCAVALALCAVAPAAAGQGVDETCPFALTRLEPSVSNALLIDTHSVYWIVAYEGVPGTRIRISGEFPHSRYMSFVAYDPEARPADALTDDAIVPNAGSTNPFRPHANRNRKARSYTAFVDFGPRPAHPAPNTLYTGLAANGSPNYTGQLWYRVYLPDRGRDMTGGVGVPRVDLEAAGSTQGAITPDVCSHAQVPTLPAIDQALAGANGPPTLPLGGYPGRNPPRWKLFTSFGESIREILLDNATTGGFPQGPSSPVTLGFFANRDNAYIYAPTSRGFGPLIVIRGRAPTFPNTWPPAAVMPSGKQVRYFSFCQYDPLSERVIDCRADDEIPVDRSGNYTIVVSTPADRPANARPACGVAWIAWGPQTQGLLIYRQMLAAPGFKAAIARIGAPGNEQRVMGSYFPRTAYLPSKAAFEARGCPRAAQHRRRKRKRRHHPHRRRNAAMPGHHRRRTFTFTG